MKIHNPIAFRPLQVTVITSVAYVALIVTLLLIHLVVPSAPNNPTAISGTNLTEAWQDLQTLSGGFHPYNSRRNDDVRDWLLRRINTILVENDVGSSHVSDDRRYAVPGNSSKLQGAPAVVFSDMTSNVTFSSPGRLNGSGSHRNAGLSVYFEGTNIIVYIRGSEDGDEDWWRTNNKPPGKGGVLVNAHYDSVSTGFGATDDGVGVVTVLQLMKYFTTAGHKPKKGIVALLNNGEEDFLNGAWAFSQHPMSKFAHTFLNLEGAGAGGRATLFRSTDLEVTRFYKKSMYPFGSVISADAFKRGLVRSQTDYVIFNGVLGLRGLDVAFMEPRARYHTDQDDSKHTSIDSIWHMLTTALLTVEGLASDTSSTFDGESTSKGEVPSGKGSDGVWFDLLGRAFAVFQLHTLFALSITLLVAAPVTLILIGAILYKVDRFYLFSSSKHHHHAEGDDLVSIQGLRGIVRFPVIIIFSSAAVVGLAFLLTKINPYIVHSSPYAVWSMMLSAWLFLAWFLSRAADFVRPTAFQRAYSLLWMFIGSWLVLIAATIFEQQQTIAGTYFIFFYFAATFLATTISFLELFGLPRKSDYADEIESEGRAASPRSGSISSGRLLGSSSGEQQKQSTEQNGDEEEEATESTSLLPGGRRTTFPHYSSAHPDSNTDEHRGTDEKKKQGVYGDEQTWSSSLPTWTWLLQFLVLAPFLVILMGQIALLFTSATYQTLQDGNSPLLLYVGIAALTVLILAPLGPFLHRYTYHIPTFLLLVFAGTLIYNLIAFPFSPNNRLKLYFLQSVDLDTGINRVSLTGIGDPYLSEAIHSLPSVAGEKLDCAKSSRRRDLTECAWNGLAPQVVKTTHPPGVPPELGYADWLSLNITRNSTKTEARFRLAGKNTRNCKILFNKPVSDFRVRGAGDDKRFQRVSEDGSSTVFLWSRTWEKVWDVDVFWEAEEGEEATGLDGRVVCLWSDDNETGVIPALDEARLFLPDWVAVTKTDDGLVEGSKAFMV